MRIITAFLLLFCISQYSQGDMALEHAKNNYEKKLETIETAHVVEVKKLQKELLAEYAKAIDRAMKSGNKSPLDLMKEHGELKKEIEDVKIGSNGRVNMDVFPLAKRNRTREGWEVDPVQINGNTKKIAIKTVDGKDCDYIYAHANSSLEYEIPKGVTRFTAQGYSYGDKLLVFKVLVDGVVKYESKPLKEFPNGYVVIDQAFPPDSKTLTLVVDALDSNRGDNSVWINPTLFK